MDSGDKKDGGVRRIEIGEGFYILAISGSSDGNRQMRQQAAKAMKKVRDEGP